MIAIKLITSGQDTGWCKINSRFGAVCLFENASGEIDTYRVSKTDWDASAPAGTLETTVVSNIKAVSNSFMDKVTLNGSQETDYVDWMDSYHCKKETEGANTVHVCMAFMPKDDVNSITQGYPRWDPIASQNNEVSYVRLTGAATAIQVANDWEITGATALVSSFIAAIYLLCL